MIKIGSVFVAVLCLASFTGCKKGGGDCAASINGMMDRMMADQMKAAGDKMTPEMKKMGEEMMKTMSTTMIQVCTEDKWSAEALKCIDDAKDQESAQKCDSTLTDAQKKHVDDAMSAAMGMGASKHKAHDEAPTAPAPAGTPPAAPAGTPPAAPAAPAGN